MKFSLHIPDFTWPGGPSQLGPDLARIVETAEDCGFDMVSVMDHVFQIGPVGPIDHDMLECYTTLGFLAARTSRINLTALVTAAPYRHPGLLAKAVTTLNVLSGGRAWLGIGAGWNEEEAKGLGIPFPPLKDRFEMLEETLQICLQMWRGDEQPYQGKHYRLERPLNAPQALTRPHPPILIGGRGERKTLRLVARYGDACNLFAGPDLQHKLDVLRAHCETEGRDYDSIMKTCTMGIDPGDSESKVDEVIDQLRKLQAMGIQMVTSSVRGVHNITPLEVIGRKIIPALADQ